MLPILYQSSYFSIYTFGTIYLFAVVCILIFSRNIIINNNSKIESEKFVFCFLVSWLLGGLLGGLYFGSLFETLPALIIQNIIIFSLFKTSIIKKFTPVVVLFYSLIELANFLSGSVYYLIFTNSFFGVNLFGGVNLIPPGLQIVPISFYLSCFLAIFLIFINRRKNSFE
jgi:hypothetical protein